MVQKDEDGEGVGGLDRKVGQGDDEMSVVVGQGNEMEDAPVWGGFLISEWLSQVCPVFHSTG